MIRLILLISIYPSLTKSCPFLRNDEDITELNSNYLGFFESFHPQIKKKNMCKKDTTPLVYSSSKINYKPGICHKTEGSVPFSSPGNICQVWHGLEMTIKDFMNSTGGTSPSDTDLDSRSSLFGKAVRLAWHDAGEADIRANDKLGPDGCLSSDAENRGLLESSTLVYTFIEPLWQDYCDKISRADFWALFAKLAAEAADPTSTLFINYYYGRKDNSNCEAGVGRLPSAQFGLKLIKQVFVTQLGLTMADAVTLIGAHTLGSVHPEFSGYGVGLDGVVGVNDSLAGAWDITPSIFDNQYYDSLLQDWTNAFVPGNINKTQWISGTNITVMLNTDISLAYNASTDNGFGFLPVYEKGNPNAQTCGGPNEFHCKSGAEMNDTSSTLLKAFDLVELYKKHNDIFLREFATSFEKLTTVGYGIGVSGKLGTLSAVNCKLTN